MRGPIKRSLAALVSSVALVGALAFVAPTAANAEPDEGAELVPLTAVSIDPVVAAQNGFDVRTDANGWQCSVPVGTPEGLCPEDGFRLKVSGVSPMNVVYGDCGYAWMYWRNGKSGYETGYQIYTSMGAGPISHAYSASFDTSSGPIFHNLTGIPPWGSWRWVHTGSLGGPTGYYGESGGSVLLSNGVGCNSGLAVAD